jgi:hypothetical protein
MELIMKKYWTLGTVLGLVLVVLLAGILPRANGGAKDYDAARWDPLHFRPAISTASDEQCLACHREILERKPRAVTPAGVKADDALAWYQTLDTYAGEQDTFHRRHLLSPYAERVMALRCNTCHQGSDPREEAPIPPSDTGTAGFTLRKTVNPETCLMCHGKFNYQVMGLPSDWPESSRMFGNSCLTCHAAIRTTRHQVNFLDAEAIEEAGQESADACYGCHGGRAWYRINYPYPRHAWPGMAPGTPEWATDRPTQSEQRFLVDNTPAKSQAGDGK